MSIVSGVCLWYVEYGAALPAALSQPRAESFLVRFPDYEHSTQTNTPPEAETATVEQILEAYNKGNLDTLLNVLARRPREFAQQLNRICRAFPAEVERVAVALQQVGDQLPVETLVRLHNQYANAARGVG